MKRNMLNRVVAMLVFVAVFAGCKTKTAVVVSNAPSQMPETPAVSTTPVANPTSDPKSDKLASLKTNQAGFTTLSAKAKAALAMGSNSNDVTMNIRIKNNEAIWVSVTAIAGLEVARALITPDSVKVLNRLENEYIKKPFSYLYEFTNNKINFGTLQSILIGNSIPEFLNGSVQMEVRGNQSELTNTMESIIYSLVLNEDNKVTQANLRDESAGQSLVVNYADFQSVAQQRLPHSVIMKSQAKNKNINLELRFTKIELDVPIDIPFKAPDRFTIKN